MYKEEKEKDVIWRQIAKIINIAMAIKDLDKIEKYQIEYIINAILGYSI